MMTRLNCGKRSLKMFSISIVNSCASLIGRLGASVQWKDTDNSYRNGKC